MLPKRIFTLQFDRSCDDSVELVAALPTGPQWCDEPEAQDSWFGDKGPSGETLATNTVMRARRQAQAQWEARLDTVMELCGTGEAEDTGRASQRASAELDCRAALRILANALDRDEE